MAQQRAHAGKSAPQRSRADTFVAAAGKKRAQIGDPQIADIFQRRRFAQMAGQKIEKLTRIALIGLKRIFRQAARIFQRLQSFFPRGCEIGAGRDQKLAVCRHKSGRSFALDSQGSVPAIGYRLVFVGRRVLL